MIALLCFFLSLFTSLFKSKSRLRQRTRHSVALSLKILKEKGHPIAQQLLRDFAGAEASDDATSPGGY